ncbi:alpha-ketoglutarate-dependent dioxygenase AlkB family protein [Aidingimonas halophila]|nr:alpha-ketoglutarate-dependent dioxygenase AlkB [Aidingimonas halophila]GHC27229.1 alpha-ketoglutarate-dependent dioxygenase AlkB [Aidingimonas halophila]
MLLRGKLDAMIESLQPWQCLLAQPPIWHYSGVLGDEHATQLMYRLDSELPWERPSLTLYGRRHAIPRQQVWMGDSHASYRYSGRDFTPAPWHPGVADLKQRIESLLAVSHLPSWRFNSVLLNRYEGGDDRMGWHSDDEPELGDDPVVAAVSLGAERPLRMRWKDKRAEAFNLWLPHDGLLLMGPGTQHWLQHALLPRRIPGLRISLTFRHVE